jgi:WD40 repeat protein
VTVFDVGNALEVARIAHPEAVVDVAVSPDGRWLATLADEGVARLWVIQPRDLIRQACARVSAPCGR